ncbi:MAG: phosphoribosylaminoimidazolesuccinocarboxamide synthase [Patescibacteria group bacterium]
MKKLSFPPALSSLKLVHQGKTRDTFEIPGHPDLLLIVATCRVSTHDVIHLNTIPQKDYVLTAFTIFWFTGLLTQKGIPHHLMVYGLKIYKYLPGNRFDYPDDLHLRAIIVKKLTIIPFEFIFRAYMAGSLWRKFYSKGEPDPYGLDLPRGIKLMHRFPQPVFTPTHKSDTDDPISAAFVEGAYPEACALSARVYNCTRDLLLGHRIELVDSKFEVGFDDNGKFYMADEVVTPDSSRFTELYEIKEGEDSLFLDKQPLRDEAEREWASGPKKPLSFSSKAVQDTTKRYRNIFHRASRLSLEEFQAHWMS